MGNSFQKPSSDLTKLRDELKCCVCLKLFEEPKSLPCGHICCAACVQGLIDAANQPVSFITCPECREEVRVPAKRQFPTAFVVKKLAAHFTAEAEHPNEDKTDVTEGQCSACHKFGPCQESLFCLGCHDNFLALSTARREKTPNPVDVAKAEGLRLQGVQAYEQKKFAAAVQLYTESIRECPRPICLIDRAEANLKRFRFPHVYVDANEALKLDPRNEKAKMLREVALKWMGMGQEEKKEAGQCAIM